MQFLQAKNGDNKLHARNNLPYAIDEIKIEGDCMLINVTSYDGVTMYTRYKSLDRLRKDFDVIDAIGEMREYKEY